MVLPMAVLAAAAGLFAVLRRLLVRATRLPGITVRPPTDDTRMHDDGAVRSIQSADIVLPAALLGELWSARTLERLARTYWAFLSTVTLGLIRVYYTPGERYVCLLFRPFKLITFQAPEYEISAVRGIVRWRIKKGLLVAARGHGGDGYLEIDVRRLASDEPAMARVNVEVEVANFYPAIASRLGRFLYTHTQSRIHVIVTHGFLRRLAKRRLEESVTGRFATPEPEPAGTAEPARAREKARPFPL